MSSRTSLARQLDNLKAAESSVFKQRKGRASFLYDFKEASAIDAKTHFAVASKGLEALCQLDDSFAEFRETLFSEFYQNAERSLQSAELNEELDKEIESFLYKVLPFFLQNASHKTLEWLIYRFRINEFNCDSFICCLLPYHETRFFVRALQTCADVRKPTSKWHWLKPNLKEGTPLAKSVLIERCATDSALLKMIYDSLKKAVRFVPQEHVYSSFVAAVMIGVIDKKTHENCLAVVMTYISKGIKSKSELYTRGAYSVLAYLCVNVKLTRIFVDKIIRSMTKRCKQSIVEDFLKVLCLICNSQDIDCLPKEVLDYIEVENCKRYLDFVNTGKFKLLVLRGFISECQHEAMLKKAVECMSSFNLNYQDVVECLKEVCRFFDSSEAVNLHSQLHELIICLERKFPEFFDRAVVHSVSNNMMFSLMKDTRYQLLDANIPLVMGLAHSDLSVREASINHVLNLAKSDQKNLTELCAKFEQKSGNFIRQTFNSILEGDDPKLIQLILPFDEFLKQLFTKENLCNLCCHILNRCIFAELNESDEEKLEAWLQLRKTAVSFYCENADQQEYLYLNTICYFLFPLKQRDLEILQTILQSKSSNQSPILNVLGQKCKDLIKSCKVKEIQVLIFEELAKFIIENDSKMVEVFVNSELRRIHVFALLVFAKALIISKGEKSVNTVGKSFIALISKILRNNKFKLPKGQVDQTQKIIFDFYLNSCLNSLETKKLDITVINYVLNMFEEKTLIFFDPNFDLKDPKISKNQIFNLYKVLLTSAKKDRIIRNEFKSLVDKIIKYNNYKIISWLWCNEDAYMQMSSLIISKQIAEKFCPLNDRDFIFLLIALRSSNYEIRCCAADLLKAISDSFKDDFLTYCVSEVESIKNNAEEISNIISKKLKTKSRSKKTQRESLLSLETINSKWIELIQSDTTPLNLKLGLVLLLSRVDDVKIICECLPRLGTILNKETDSDNQMLIVDAIVSHFKNPNLIESGIINQELIINLFINCLETKYASTFATCILSKDEFMSFITSFEDKFIILKQLLILASNNDQDAKNLLKKLLIDAELTALLMDKILNDFSTASSHSEFSIENKQWKMIITLLEVIQSIEQFKKSNLMLKQLFEILRKTFSIEAKSSLEYLRHLLLSSIACCIKQEADYTKYFPIDLIFECLRESHQRETQKLALSILNDVAADFKNEILQNLMTILAFIGTNISQCDNQLTIELIFTTMNSIVETLLKVDDQDLVNKLLEVLVNSIPDIPSHRRLFIFERLTKIIQKKIPLAVILLKILTGPTTKSNIDQSSLRDLAVLICLRSDFELQMKTVIYFLEDLLKHLIDEKQSHLKKQFNLQKITRKLVKENISKFILQVISDNEFVAIISREDIDKINVYFDKIIYNLMALIEQTTNRSDLSMKGFTIYYKRVNTLFYQILFQVNVLLPNFQMVQLVSKLLRNDSFNIQKKALEMLNDKLIQLSEKSLEISQCNEITECLDKLIQRIDSSNRFAQEEVYNAQLAMISYKLLAKQMSDSDEGQNLITRVINMLLKILQESSQSTAFTASCLLCLAQLFSHINAKAITFLPTLMSVVLNLFSSNEPMIITANLTAISKITQHFVKFLSPYLDDILIKVCNLRTDYSNHNNIQMKIKIIYGNLTKLLPARVLVKSIDSTFDKVFATSSEILIELMNLLEVSTANVQKDDVSTVSKILNKSVLKFLEYRNAFPEKEQSVIESVENACLNAITLFIKKLSENSFRPFFYKLFDWAIRENEGKLFHRIITFYRLQSVLADNLQSLFCLFAVSFVNNSIELLNFCCHSNDEQQERLINEQIKHQLICSILSTLSKCFLFDSNGRFLNKERAKLLIPPIIDQLECVTESEKQYEERAQLTCECVKNLVHSFNDEPTNKDLNYQILLKTRNSSSKVRFFALKALRGLILEMKENYTTLLPESIQFIAELNEDDSTEVEKLVHNVIDDLEQVIGQPISNFL